MRKRTIRNKWSRWIKLRSDETCKLHHVQLIELRLYRCDDSLVHLQIARDHSKEGVLKDEQQTLAGILGLGPVYLPAKARETDLQQVVPSIVTRFPSES